MSAKRTTSAALTPREIVARLAPVYGKPEWRPHGDAMTELILTVLSQNTSDTNSGRAFMRLRSRFPEWSALMDAGLGDIESEITAGGLARVKAPRIKAILQEVWRRCGAFDLPFLCEMPLAQAKEWLRSLPGVGPKTAACVLMFALGLPVMPVDTHVHRVSQRLGLVPAKATAEHAHDILEAMLGPGDVYPLHILLIKHGRRMCRAQRPQCSGCPLLDGCPFGRGAA